MQIHRKLAAEKIVNNSGICTGATLNYIVSECGEKDAASEALELVRSTAPLAVNGARRESIRLRDVPGGGVYEFEVCYSRPEPREENSGGEKIWRLEVKTVRTNVTSGIELVRIIPGNDGTAAPPDPGTLIGWDGVMDGDSAVSGTVVLQPEMFEYCTATCRAARINSAFRRKLFSLVGKVNSSPFHGWDPGEVLLVKVSQEDPYTNSRGVDLVDITYTFAIRPRCRQHCGGIDAGTPDPWNVLWSISARNRSAAGTEVRGVYESRVYEYGNFSALNL